jgi:hypothetical protein
MEQSIFTHLKKSGVSFKINLYYPQAESGRLVAAKLNGQKPQSPQNQD